MTQAKELLGAIKPQNELELLIDSDSNSAKFDDSDDAAAAKAPAKAAKGKSTRRTPAKKKHSPKTPSASIYKKLAAFASYGLKKRSNSLVKSPTC